MMYLQQPVDSDLDLMFLWRKFSCDPEPILLSDHMVWVANLKSRDHIKAFTIRTAFDRIGIGYFDISDKTAKVALYLNPEFIGHHFGRGALATSIAYGFIDLELETISGDCHAANDAAIRLYEDSGFARQQRDVGHVVTYTLDRATWNTSLFPF